jgi:hypothetical protein
MKASQKLKSKKKQRTVRVTLDLTEKFYARLQELESKVSIVGKANVIREALQLYEYFVNRTREGSTFKVIGRNGQEESLVILGPTAIEQEVP